MIIQNWGLSTTCKSLFYEENLNCLYANGSGLIEISPNYITSSIYTVYEIYVCMNTHVYLYP